MKSILLLDTSIATANMGDEIINVSIKKNWGEMFSDNYVVNLPTHTPVFKLWQRVLYKQKMSLYEETDYKFLCGTNALYTNMLRPLPAWNINLFDANFIKQVICLGVGIGENGNRAKLYTKRLYSKVLSRDYKHSVRDEKAKDFLESMGFNAINTGCPTLWGLDAKLCTGIRRKKADNVVFTLTYYLKDEINDKKMIDCLKKNYANVYFWPQCFADLQYLQQLCDLEGIHIIPANLNAYDRILNEEIDYVGNRLHGGIYALQHMCRTVIIGIDYRVREMNETYTLPSIEREEIDEKLDCLINGEWETKPIGIDINKINEWKSQFM
ncbi:MAG: polysaccharide pyruvyl transferase family protein [Roseburia sp.]|nr:polysaccharide pyruvyl transferase family protein [Roseburia sp.]